MADTEAEVGYGSKVEISTDGEITWDEILEVFEITPPSITVTNPTATHMQSPAAEKIPGKIPTYGQPAFNMNWIPGSAADVKILSLVTGGRFSVRETFPNGVSWKIKGLFASMTPAVPMEDRMTCAVTLDATGALAVGAAAAPANARLPAISGTPQVGQTLFAFPGIWTGAPNFAFQWKNEGVAINGATGQTYLVQAGDSGDNLTVTITGTNSAGAASATSAETLPVAA